MKQMTYLILALLFSNTWVLSAQEATTTDDKLSYYEQRAHEDARYEQSLELKDEEAADFWEDQQRYEKELKKRDRKAHKAYMKGKRDAYAEHYEQCSHHCHHSPHFYYHATYYYHGYHHDYYYRQPQRSSIRAGVRVATPGLRVGIL